MKKRIVSIILALVMLLSLLPTAAFAAGGDYEVDVLASKFSDVQFNNKDTMKLDFMLKTNNSAQVSGIQTALLYIDTSKYAILGLYEGSPYDYTSTVCPSSGDVGSSDDVIYSNYKTGTPPNVQAITGQVAGKIIDGKAFLSMNPNAANNTFSFDSSTSMMSILLGLKEGVEWDALTSDSIRLATADEASSFNATGAVTINAPNAEGTSDTYVYRPANGGEDSLTITPTLASDGSFTFADSTGGGDEGETTDGYEILYELSGSTFNGTGDTDEYVDYNAGDTVTATVYVTNKSGEDVYLQACDIYLTYDNNLTYTGNTLTKGAAYNNAGVAYGTDGFSGKVSHIQAIGSTETSADISIELKNGATATLGTITFSISDASVYDTQMPITLTTATNIGVGYETTGNKTSYSPKNVGTVSGAEVMTTYTVTWMNDDNSSLGTTEVGHNLMPAYTGKTPTKAATAQYTYTFNGWNPTVEKATKEATYTATYTTTTNTYTITWNNWDGNTLYTDTVQYGQTPSYSGDTPTKDEDNLYTYIHSGWAPEIVEVGEDTAYTATYTKTGKDYTITFNLGEEENWPTGTTVTNNQMSYTVGQEITLPKAEKAGQNFGGWTVTTEADSHNWTADNYNGTVAGTAELYGNVTLKAVWSTKPYEVTWETVDHGTVSAANTDTASGTRANAGDTINVTVIPAAGYKIGTVSYYKTADAADEDKTIVPIEKTGDVYSFTMPAYSVTVTATFVKDDLKINVDQNTQNGNVAVDPANKTTAQAEETVTLTNTPELGYVLDEYIVTYKDGNDQSHSVEVAENGTFAMPEYEVTVSATFKKADLAITITPNELGTVVAQNGDSNPIKTAQFDDTVTLVAAPVNGYELDQYTVTYTVPGSETAIPVTLNDGKFTMPRYPVTVSTTFKASNYTINFDLNGGEWSDDSVTDNQMTYTINGTGELPSPTKVNYTFKGWQAEEAVGSWTTTLINPGTSLNNSYGNVKLVAQWTPRGDVVVEEYKYAADGYVMLRVADDLADGKVYQFGGGENATMYYMDKDAGKDYLVDTNDSGVYYTLIPAQYAETKTVDGETVLTGKLNATGMEMLKAVTGTHATIDYTSGDINGDNVTNIADANIVYQMIVNGGGYYGNLDTQYRLRADMVRATTDAVHRGSILDVNAIVNIINGTTATE